MFNPNSDWWVSVIISMIWCEYFPGFLRSSFHTSPVGVGLFSENFPRLHLISFSMLNWLSLVTFVGELCLTPVKTYFFVMLTGRCGKISDGCHSHAGCREGCNFCMKIGVVAVACSDYFFLNFSTFWLGWSSVLSHEFFYLSYSSCVKKYFML